jgi:predicted aldo/keto reductase-like oxidoreductase
VDIVFTFPDYLENLKRAIDGKREKLILTGHIGSDESNGHYRLEHHVEACARRFDGMLSQLNTDYIDIAMIQMVNDREDLEEMMRPGGKLELAMKLKKEGKARFVGMSGHKVPASRQAIESGLIDVLMFPINLAWDFAPMRKAFLSDCSEKDVGLVAMKAYAGGRVFQRKELGVTPAQCISYVLDQPVVSTVVPGPKNVKEFREAIDALEASESAKNYRGLTERFKEELTGHCVYCNHCLPCPAGIDIGRVMQALDKEEQRYEEFKNKADFFYPGRIRVAKEGRFTGKVNQCTKCGVCMKRCPFGVDILEKMDKMKRMLGDNIA